MIRFFFFIIFFIVVLTIIHSISGLNFIAKKLFGRNTKPINNHRKFSINNTVSNPEKSIVQLAKKHNNVVTIVDIIRECELSSVEAEKILKNFAERGIAEMQVKESGTVVYFFHDSDSISHQNNIY